MPNKANNEMKQWVKTIIAFAFIAIVNFPFWQPALWALAVVTSVWGYRKRSLAAGRPKWVFGPVAMTLWVALCLLIPFALIASSIIVEATNAATLLTDPQRRQMLIGVIQTKFSMVTPYLARFGIAPEDLPAKAAEIIGPMIGTALSMIAGAAGTLLLDSAFFLLYTYVFFSRGAAMAEALSASLPRTAAGGIRVARTALDSCLVGVVATAVIQGAVGGLGCWVAGLPSPLLFFLAMAVASLIPAVGTMLVWGPAAVWLGVTGNYAAAAGLAAWGLLVVGSIDNFVRPVIAARFGNLDFIVATLGSLGGLALFGFSGVLFGPTLLAAGIEMLHGDPTGHD